MTDSKWRHIGGTERTKTAKKITALYAKGKSIRQIADLVGRSYGFVHQLLVENSVELRSRGAESGRRRTPRNS